MNGGSIITCPSHLYIHWPFCKNKCHYCDFVAFEKHEAFKKSYHEALCEEIRRFGTQIQGQRSIKTIFFGGGTPSLYPLPLLQELFNLLHSYFDLSACEEISLEVNPGGIDDSHLAMWKQLGINRLSIGVQVLDDAVLAKLNRFQTIADVHELFSLIPKYFDNVSADFIMGLPGITPEIWDQSLQQAFSFPIIHISNYILTVHEKTPLYFKIKKGEIKIPEDDALTSLYEKTVHTIEANGFKQYETSNFAKNECYQSIHNTAYWNRASYRGFGLGASSFDGTTRTTNIKNLNTYLKTYDPSLNKLDFSYSFCETLTQEQHKIETFMLGLRQKKGMSLKSMLYLINAKEQSSFLKHIEMLIKHNLLECRNDIITLTTKGMALENEIIISLL